jgi:muramidase (phage lysozyme)
VADVFGMAANAARHPRPWVGCERVRSTASGTVGLSLTMWPEYAPRLRWR